MSVRLTNNQDFWIVSHGERHRQIRNFVVNATDDPLTDREETIGLLCEEVQKLAAENVLLQRFLAKIQCKEADFTSPEKFYYYVVDMCEAALTHTPETEKVMRVMEAAEEWTDLYTDEVAIPRDEHEKIQLYKAVRDMKGGE